MLKVSFAVFVATVLVAAVLPTPAQSGGKIARCGAFTVFRSEDGSYRYRASNVKRSKRVRCSRARNLLRAAYGQGPLEPIRSVYPRDENGNTFGRPTIWLRGGWRCSNGAGGAICFNAKDTSFNVIENQHGDQDWAITATVR